MSFLWMSVPDVFGVILVCFLWMSEGDVLSVEE